MTRADAKKELIKAFDQAHEHLLAVANAAVVQGVVAEEGEWGPREVLAHIAGWGAEATERLPKVIAGAPVLVYDDDAFNAAIILIMGDQSFESIRQTLEQVHQRFVQMLRAQDENMFIPGHPVYERVKAVIEHHVHHAEDLEKLL